MMTSSVLFTTFTVSSTPASQWIGYQVIQGIGTGWGMQMSSLRVQLDLKDSPVLVPVGMALVMFVQQLGATVIQVVAGTVFNSQLSSRLGGFGLSPSQIRLLLGAGTTGIRKVAEKDFAELMDPILEAYNAAITRVFVSHPILCHWTRTPEPDHGRIVRPCRECCCRVHSCVWHQVDHDRGRRKKACREGRREGGWKDGNLTTSCR